VPDGVPDDDPNGIPDKQPYHCPNRKPDDGDSDGATPNDDGPPAAAAAPTGVSIGPIASLPLLSLFTYS